MVNGHEYVLSNINKYEDWSNFREIDMSTLKKYVKKLKKVGGGENGITTDIFRDFIMVAANRILDIVNVSLCYGEFPEEWKMTTVIPVPKNRKLRNAMNLDL
ncbi:hypothetical protein WA026_019535 [Henosepilachna vigintioctopunctata]|uniref:RNA-directed DNA polymerase from mobile element jockey n=1 Tax=Henosepilachna vigintioctopunctata TaxID=420089 RepID=A0AAW1TQZ7_9CUCU